MSEFHVTVVRLGPLTSHPNADTLNITKVYDYQVITKKDGFKEGELVVYVPIDSVVPDTQEWHWLAPTNPDGSVRFPVGQVPEKYRVIEAKKLRGIFSQGMLAPLPSVNDDFEFEEGDDVTSLLEITKYEPPAPMIIGGDNEAPPPFHFPVYTDIEGLRRYPNILVEGESVVLTEKIHGANARYVHDGERLWVGSHTQVKKEDPKSIWWAAATDSSLSEKLSRAPWHLFFGEVYGQVQDLKYGMKSGVKFRAFDVYDVRAQKYLDHFDALKVATSCDVEWVPTLYTGPWTSNLNDLCEGQSTLAENVREGFVVKPLRERWNQEVSRVILKRHGEGYLLRKKK